MKIKNMLKRTKTWTVRLGLFAVLLIVALLAGTYLTQSASAQPLSSPESEKIGPGVLEAIWQEGEAHVVIALTQTPKMIAAWHNIPMLKSEVASVQAQVLSSLSPAQYRGKYQYETIPGLAGTVLSENALTQLAANPNVRKIDIDVGGTGSLGISVPQIGADQRHNLGNTGEGIVVAFLDSGIDSDHPDLSDDLNQEACFGDNNGSIDGSGFCPNGSDRQTGTGAAEDDAGHGTHTTGIVTSGGVVSSQGVAPDANIVAIKVLDNCSFSGCFYAFSEIVAALDYITVNNATLGIDIINMSIVTNALFTGSCDNSTAYNMNGAASINTLRANGVIAFASSGNNGSGTQMTSPACLSNVISVGAVDSSDNVASFTDSNSTTDIMAPGVSIVSDAIGGGTTSASGTSMASPHAAGCAALLIEAGDAIAPDQIETRLETSTIQVTDATNGLTFPRINCGPDVLFTTSILRAGTSPTNIASVDFTVTFSESVTGVDKTDFALTTTGVTGASVSSVSGSGATRTVTVKTGTGNGTIRLDVVDNDSIKDASNNPLGGVGAGNGDFTSGEFYEIVFKTWYGGGSITSNRNVVAVGRPHVENEVATYNGFTSGSTSTYVPMLFKDAFGGSYDSALYIQNVDPSNTANITIRFYDNSGTETYSMPDTIQPLASKGYWLPAIPALGSSWVGGVKVESNRDIVAVGRPHVGSQVMTYNGFANGGTNAYVPMLFKDAFGGSYDSALYVQNVDPSNPANITIRFYDSSGTETYSMPDTIQPLASKGYWLPAIAPLGSSWVGGVKVESDQDIVAVGRPHVGTQVLTYNGFTGGDLNAYVPMMFKDAFGGSYDAALYIQNLDTTNTANITIRFYDSSGNETYSTTDSISALASKGYWLPAIAPLGTSWVGGVKVESDQDIVAVGRPHVGSQVMAYNGFVNGSSSAYVPMLFKDAFGGSYDSALYIQNIDPSNTANVTIQFYDTDGNLSCTVNDSISALASKGWWLPGLTCSP